jgi:hypothetical protein
MRRNDVGPRIAVLGGMTKPLALLLACGLFAMSACGSLSTVRLKDRTSYEVEIEGSTSENLYGVGRNDKKTQIPCKNIASISNRIGIGRVVSGVAFLLLGAITISEDKSSTGPMNGMGRAFGSVLLIPGIVLTLSGIVSHYKAGERASHCAIQENP